MTTATKTIVNVEATESGFVDHFNEVPVMNQKQKVRLSEKPSNQKIVNYFRNHLQTGLTVGEASDLGLGTELRKRISELKKEGFTFREVMEQNKNVGSHKRWFLIVSCK